MEKVTTAQECKAAEEEDLQSPLLAVDTVEISRMNLIERLLALVAAMRPRQWTKNLALFIGLVFAGHLFSFLLFERTTVAFIAFCLASSSIYILNDLLDLEKDRKHPVKRLRPLASGKLPVSWAVVLMSILIILCCGLIALVFAIPFSLHDIYAALGGSNVLFALSVAAYLVIMVLYSTYLKHIVLIDVFCIAMGFVLRILGGAVVVPVLMSPWLYLVTCFLSLFLALSKRRHELVLLQGQASSHRQILKEYSIPMLDQMITVVVAGTLMAYSLYTIESPTGDHRLIVTVPFVLYGMFRYLYLVYMRMEGGSPEEVLLRDRHMFGTVLLCVILTIVVLYLPSL